MQPGIWLTARDHARLSLLIAQSSLASTPLLETLEAEFQRAALIAPEAAAQVVQLGSRITWEALESGRRRTARLVLPHRHLDPSSELSVLSPVGCALIGLRIDDVFTWAEAGRRWRLRVVAVAHDEVHP